MSNIVYIAYDDSEKDFSVINGVVEKNNSLQVQVGYFGKYADKLYKMVTRQGYLVEHDDNIRAEVIAEISREIRLLYGNEYEKKIRAEVIEECAKVVSSMVGICQSSCPIDCQWGTEESCVESWKIYLTEQLKEQNNG